MTLLLTSLTLASSTSYAEEKTGELDQASAETTELLDKAVTEAKDLGAISGSSGRCVSSSSTFWVCRGDVAWGTGYLVTPDVFDLRLAPIWGSIVEKVVPRLLDERREYKVQRDAFKLELHLSQGERDSCRSTLATTSAKVVELRVLVASRYDTWDLILTGAASVGVGALLGIILAVFV